MFHLLTRPLRYRSFVIMSDQWRQKNDSTFQIDGSPLLNILICNKLNHFDDKIDYNIN